MLSEFADTYDRKLEHTDVGLPAHIPEQIYAQARIDPVTLGCNAVKSAVVLNKSGTLHRASMSYWYRLPNNLAAEINLFDIETMLDGMPMRIAVAGRPVNMGDARAVEAVLQAIRHIHEDLKESRYPNIALAFHENELDRHIGKTIKIVGQKNSGEPDFAFAPLFNYHAGSESREDMAVPTDPDLFKALLGLGANPLRPDLNILASRLRVVPAYEVFSQTAYENRLQASETRHGGLRLHMVTHKRGEKSEDTTDIYKNLFHIETRGGARPALQQVSLMGQHLKGKGYAAQARALGAASGMVAAFARHAAPVPLMHLVNYDLRAMIADPQVVAQMEGIEKPFLRISLAGNRYTKIYGPYGNDLGNCKLLMHAGVRIMHDFALKPAPDGEKSSGSIPTITDWLPDLDVLCVTHRHIDHAGGIPYEDFRGKTIMATPQVIDHIRDTMRTVHGSKAKDRMPDFLPLTKNGYHTISKDGGKSGITILYSPNATPHSAYCTPFYYAAFDTKLDGKKIIKGIYVNLGDTRDEDDVADWWFRTGWQKLLLEAHPDLDIFDIPSQPTFAEWDSTSVRYHGATPGRAEVLDNMKMAASWFEGYAILNAHLASSDNQFDIMIQCAADSGRDFTTFGKNMESTQRIQNIFGYEELNEPWPQGHQNQARMDQVHSAKLLGRLESLLRFHPSVEVLGYFNGDMNFEFEQGARLRGKARKAFRENLTSGDLDMFDHYLAWKKAEKKEDKIEADVHRLYLMHKWLAENGHENEAKYAYADLTRALHVRLMRYSNNYWRFKRRAEYAQTYKIADLYELGPLSITRATLTSASMFSGNPERMYVGLTGSQGNEVEIEAQLPKFLEKRSLLNLDPRYRHTARPLDPKQAVLMLTQPAIVGNEKVRQRLVHKAAREYGMIVVNATHDGFEIYNTHRLAPEVLQKIRTDLGARRAAYREDMVDHRMIVPGPLPLGVPGARAARGHGTLDAAYPGRSKCTKPYQRPGSR